MTTYDDQFVKMPMRILSISHINGIKFSDSSKTLYCYLKGFDKAFPSYSKIGEVFSISARAAEERVKKLVELGLVIKTRRFSSSNLYEVLEIPGQEESNEVGQTPDMPEIVDSFFFDDTEEDTSQEMKEEKQQAVIVPESVPESVTSQHVEKPDDDVITDEIKIDAVCDLLSKKDSLRQQSRGDSFINYARRVLQRNHKKLPSRLEERLEMRFENLFPHFYSRFGIPF